MTPNRNEIVGLGRLYIKCSSCVLDNLDWFEICDRCRDIICVFCHEACIECDIPLCKNCSGKECITVLDDEEIAYSPIYLCGEKNCKVAFSQKSDSLDADQWLDLLRECCIHIGEGELVK